MATLITPGMREWIGRELGSVSIEIEKGTIAALADAVGDANPLWTDSVFAAKNRYRGLVAPPALFMTIEWRGNAIRSLNPTLTRLLDGGGDYTFLRPVRVGDVLTARTTLKELYERPGRSGPMLFQVFETAWINQKGEVVAEALSLMICY